MTTWERALDDLECHVHEAERLLAAGRADALSDWTAPQGLPPLPRHLVPRARALVERQQAALELLPGLLGATRNQLRVGRRIGAATARPTTPVYLDVTA